MERRQRRQHTLAEKDLVERRHPLRDVAARAVVVPCASFLVPNQGLWEARRPGRVSAKIQDVLNFAPQVQKGRRQWGSLHDDKRIPAPRLERLVVDVQRVRLAEELIDTWDRELAGLHGLKNRDGRRWRGVRSHESLALEAIKERPVCLWTVTWRCEEDLVVNY